MDWLDSAIPEYSSHASTVLKFSEAFPSTYSHRIVHDVFKGETALKKFSKITSTTDPIRSWLLKVCPSSLWTAVGMDPAQRDWHAVDGGPPIDIPPFIDRLARFIVAMTGGLLLVVPMLIMRLHEDSKKSLVTTSVAVILFAGLVSIGFKASDAETSGITAAYAAVLVVFVGTSTNT